VSRRDDAPPTARRTTPMLDRVPPIFLAVMSQVIALVIVWPAAVWIGYGIGYSIPILGILIVQGIAAALISHFAGLARWWLVLQIALPPAGLALHQSSVPAWVYLAIVVLLAAVFWNTLSERVPLYLTNRRTVDAIDALLPKGRTFRFADIGCGIASVLGPLARRHPAAEFVGVESAPLPYGLGALRLWIVNRRNARIDFVSLWDHSLADYDVVYCFLSPAPMAALFEKATAEMKPGSLFVSNSFLVPGHTPQDTVAVDDRRQTKLHLWRIGGTGKPTPEAEPEPAPEAAD
jgi:hypothetical protein